ncbi:MAG TPA: hypothetical protein VJU52_15665 [Flavobacterium sp.]|nr:hypothetical protein [Flavobacterium sp.]
MQYLKIEEQEEVQSYLSDSINLQLTLELQMFWFNLTALICMHNNSEQIYNILPL